MKNFNFKKVFSVLGGIVMVGASMGTAFATSYPNAVQNGGEVALVYGSGSAASDLTSATNLSTNLLSYIDNLNQKGNNITVEDSSFITETEVVLGSNLTSNGKFKATITDNKLSSLADGKLYWDDGESSKTSYNVHEEILLGNMKLITTLDDDELNKTALTNNKDLEYKYIFDESINTDLIGDEDADTLKITVLGKDYEIQSFDGNSITLSDSEQKIVRTDDTIVYDGKSLTIEEIFYNSVQINGVIISEGKTKKVGNLKVYVDEIAYYSSGTTPNKAIIKVGKDLSQTINDGDDYNESEDDSEWIWTIKNPGQKDGYIGVKYNQRQTNADDNVVYSGQGYVFPEDFATVRFDKLTDVEYGKYDLSFEDSVNLYNNSDGNNLLYEDAKVLVLTGATDNSFEINDVETNEIYLKYGEKNILVNSTWNETIESPLYNGTIVHPAIFSNQSLVEVFYNDIEKDYSTSTKPRWIANITESENMEVGKLVYGDTELPISLNGTSRVLNVGDLSITLNPTGEFTYLGVDDDNSENMDVMLEGKDISERDNNNILSHKGILVKSVESNADSNEVRFEVPDEQVYGEVTVSNSVIVNNYEDVSLNTILVTDNEIESVKNRNLIIVGGSCINKIAAQLIGVSENTCGEAFTTATGIGTGQYLIKEYTSPYNSDKFAFLVAGYEAQDTINAVNSIA